MTNLPRVSHRSAPLNTVATATVFGPSRILPIMSAPPPTGAISNPYQDVQQDVPHFQGNHRRKPPESASIATNPNQQHGRMDASGLPSQLNFGPPSSTTPREPSRDQSHGDSGLGLESSTGSQQGMRSEQPVAMDIGIQGAPLYSSGNSSGGEGQAMEGNSSGESGMGRLASSTAEDWFNTFNRDVRGNQSYPNYENDSPYYMPSHHRRKQPTVRHQRPGKSVPGGFQGGSVPPSFRGAMGIPESTEESNSDSFRSVIDDLTIKNQKLKKRLRKLEGIQHGHSTTHAEQLFELRVHNLPEDKQLELERVLQLFTASLDQESLGQSVRPDNKTTSGDRSSAIDSGYASVSRSGNDSSRGTKSDEKTKSLQSRSELSKMKLVVRKLEQLFTGAEGVVARPADVDGRVLQQQNISKLAAAEDNEAKVLAGGYVGTEGNREASLMSPPGHGGQLIDSDSRESLVQSEEPEQRPTRPLDLDPQREQFPEENIEYLTHMTESSVKGPPTGGGWVYLNLIINMAQLHTINVTPPFIKKAIAAVSSRLELSSDGKMVRWKGYPTSSEDSSAGTGMSTDGSMPSPAMEDVKSDPPAGDSSASRLSSGTESGLEARALNPQPGNDHKFHYRPIIARSFSFEDESSSCMTSDTDPDYNKRSSSGDSRGAVARRDNGPIIFYKGGGFCTDLMSRPLRESEMEYDGTEPMKYTLMTSRPLGLSVGERSSPPSPSTKDESPLFNAGAIPPDEEAMHIDNDDSSVIDFSPEFDSNAPTTPPVPITFEASGIGGVLPADNFAINCETKHYLLPENQIRLPISRSRALRTRLQKRILHRIPKASIDAFHEHGNAGDSSAGSSATKLPKAQRVSPRRLVRHEVLSANTLKLPPSTLPPASFIFLSPSEDSSSNGETDDDAPRSSGSEGYFYHQGALDTYRTISSGEESGTGANRYQRSPSSAATAGDGSRGSSVFSGHGSEDQTYDMPLSMDSEQSSSVGTGSGPIQHTYQPVEQEKPTLKRSRGSVISSGSNHQVRKSARMQTSSLQSSGEDS